MPTGTSVSATSSSRPSLRLAVVSTWPPDSLSSCASFSVSGSGRPSMRDAGQPNSCSAGLAPAGDCAVTIGENEAGVDELAQQLFDDLRGGGL